MRRMLAVLLLITLGLVQPLEAQNVRANGMGPVLPAVCTAGDVFFLTTSTAIDIRVCQANNTWTSEGSAIVTSGVGGAAWGAITGTLSNQSDLQTALNGKAATSHTHVESDVTNLTTDLSAKQATSAKGQANGYASLDGSTKIPIAQVPTGSTSSTVTIGNDSRLSDARAPTAHASSHQSGGSDAVSVTALSGFPGGSTTYLRADGSFATPAGGGGSTVLRVANNVSSSDAVNWANVTGLTTAVAANTAYSFSCNMTYSTAATTTALQLSINGPASPTNSRYAVWTMTTATAMHGSSISSYDTVTNPGTGGGATTLPVRIEGTLENGANAGTLAIRLRSEVGSSAVTIQRGSFCVVY